MASHPADRRSANPRIQCVVCAKWMRLYQKENRPPWDSNQLFFGGCTYAPGHGEHLARKGADDDVCVDCCENACQQIAIARAAG